jgi:replicative DNA helicase
MNIDYSTWYNTELAPAMFENVDRLLPELNFVRRGNTWASPLNIDGTQPKNATKTKTVVQAKYPAMMFENGEGGKLQIVEYIARRENCTAWDAKKKAAAICGVAIPQRNYTAEEVAAYHRRQGILQDVASYFNFCLKNATAGKEVVEYLKTRGYTEELIDQLIDQGLGANPGRQKVVDYLKGRGYTEEEIEQGLPGYSDQHPLTIEYNAGGKLYGFKLRAIDPSTPKDRRYASIAGISKDNLYNLPGLKCTDLVLVEGELDAILANTALAGTIHTAVAATQAIPTQAQIKNAVARGFKSFTLCLDSGEENTVNTINRVIEKLLENEVAYIYVAQLPHENTKTDADSFIVKHGSEAFKTVIAEATAWYFYQLRQIVKRYLPFEALNERQVDELIEEVVVVGHKINEPIQRQRYNEQIKIELGFYPEAVLEAQRRLDFKAATEKQLKQLKEWNAKQRQSIEAGNVAEAIAAGEKLAAIKAIDSGQILEAPKSYSQIIEDLRYLPASYKTGYPALDEFIGIAPAAITLVAGRPSHGKTTVLYNLALNFTRLYPAKKVYFFTYEEPRTAIYIKMLNCIAGSITTEPLSAHYYEEKDLPKRTNLEFIKAYLRRGRNDIPQLEQAQQILKELTDSGRLVVEERNYSVEQLAQVLTKEAVEKENIGAVFIDYIQRMNTEAISFQDKRLEVAYISDRVLQIAKTSGLPVILGAQAKRTTNDKIKLDDLKEAGNLEEDANLVLGLFNEHRGNTDKENVISTRDTNLIITALKNRDGEVNRSATLVFDQHTGTIKEQHSGSTINTGGLSFSAQ